MRRAWTAPRARPRVAVGEHLGYLLTGVWSALVGAALVQSTVAPAWLVATGVALVL